MNMHEIRAWANCCEEFKAEIKAIAREYGLNFWKVYSLWRLYSKRCDWGDQSPLLSEFREQYKSDFEKLRPAEPTVTQIAARFGCTEEQVRAQFRRNALKIKAEAERIRAGGRNPNDFDPEYLDQRAERSEPVSRSEINQALSKALAYVDCGKFDEAEKWGFILIRRLELVGVFQAGQVGCIHP